MHAGQTLIRVARGTSRSVVANAKVSTRSVVALGRAATWSAVVTASVAIRASVAFAQPTTARVGVSAQDVVGNGRIHASASGPADLNGEAGFAQRRVGDENRGRAFGVPRLLPRSGLFGRDSAWWVPLSSAIIPGTGQARLGQDRFVGYLTVETYAIVGWAAGEAEVSREQQRYRALAHDIARAFVPGNDAVGDWDYYEAMEKHIESGVFDRNPGTGSLGPETDTATFNGSIWLKARQLSDWPSVNVEPSHSSSAYQSAITYYVAHAVGPEFRWSWRNAQLEWDVYRQSIRRKNDASHDASNYLAVIAFNHLLSAVDAFVTLRLRGGLGAGRKGYRLTATWPLAWRGARRRQ